MNPSAIGLGMAYKVTLSSALQKLARTVLSEHVSSLPMVRSDLGCLCCVLRGSDGQDLVGRVVDLSDDAMVMMWSSRSGS